MRPVLFLAAVLMTSGCAGSERAGQEQPAAGVMPVNRKPDDKPPAGPVARKVIYTAEVVLTVENLDEAQARLKDLVKQEKGYIASSETSGTTRGSRMGRWQVRVPVGQLDAFLAAVAALGERERIKLDSRDVTEEFYDTDARVRNKKIEEERLLKHLKESTGKLEDILAVERELSRVRDEIERAEGRLRLLANLVDLTTITVSLHERGSYLPDDLPSYGTVLGRTFFNSINLLIEFAKGLLMVLVGAVPWLVVLAAVVVPLRMLWRRLRPVRPPASLPTTDNPT